MKRIIAILKGKLEDVKLDNKVKRIESALNNAKLNAETELLGIEDEMQSVIESLTNTDVNINNGVYEINLATFDVDTSTISNLVNVAPYAKKVIAATLTAGQTTLTINDDCISPNSHFKFETEIYGVAPKTATPTQGQLVLGFKAQNVNMGVIVTVSN